MVATNNYINAEHSAGMGAVLDDADWTARELIAIRAKNIVAMDTYLAWYDDLPERPTERVLAILARYLPKYGAHGVPDSVITALCPGVDTRPILKEFQQTRQLRYRQPRAPHGGLLPKRWIAIDSD